jgi:hypothetical protein
LSGFGSTDSLLSDPQDPSSRSVTRALRYDASAEEVREAVQGLVGIAASSVHVDRMSPTATRRLTSSTSNQVSFNGAFSWRITLKPPTAYYYHSNDGTNGWNPPKLAVLKNTIAECAHVETVAGAGGEGSFYAQSTNRGTALRRNADGKNCFSVYTGSGPAVKVETIQQGRGSTVKPLDNQQPPKELIVSDLDPFTLYAFRVRSRNAKGYSEWSSASTPVRTLHHLGPNGYIPLDVDTRDTAKDVLLHNYNKELVWMESGSGDGIAANMIDPDYAYGVGKGGAAGGKGGDGFAVLSSYVSGQSEPSRVFYFYSGKDEVYTVPHSSVNGISVDTVVARLWGAGGGAGSASVTYGNSSNRGGGGAFVEVKLAVKSGDRLKVRVGEGGYGVTSAVSNGGASTFGGGGEGGYGDHGGGASGGGATSLYFVNPSSFSPRTQDEVLVAIAAGGGGGGTSHVCCSNGGAGRNADADTDITNLKLEACNGQSPSASGSDVVVASSGGQAARVTRGGTAGASGSLEVRMIFVECIFYMQIC